MTSMTSDTVSHRWPGTGWTQSAGSQFQLSGDPLPQQGHPTEEKAGGGSAQRHRSQEWNTRSRNGQNARDALGWGSTRLTSLHGQPCEAVLQAQPSAWLLIFNFLYTHPM